MFKTIFQGLKLAREFRKRDAKEKENVSYQVFINGKEINTIVINIRSFQEKISNLIFKNDLSTDLGYRFVGRKGISTIGLREPSDIIVCDAKMTIIDFYESIPPQKVTHHYDEARYIFVFSKDFIKRYNIKIKDILTTKKISQY
jgi:hypothetical protein